MILNHNIRKEKDKTNTISVFYHAEENLSIQSLRYENYLFVKENDKIHGFYSLRSYYSKGHNQNNLIFKSRILSLLHPS